MGDATIQQTTSERAEPAQAYDLFVVHAAADAHFVRGYLLPALDGLPAPYGLPRLARCKVLAPWWSS